jgi:TldD protein
MHRRIFIKITGVTAGALLVPVVGRRGSALAANSAVSDRKRLADIALNAATKSGATYVDVRIGRYLNQFIVTRDTRVENLTNTESYGIGIRVIVDGTWGFAASADVTPDSIAKVAEAAVAVAKANARFQTEPVELAPVSGVGEVSWQTLISKNAFEVPIKDKIDLLMVANREALNAGASFINTSLFMVNEQKYFASTDGSYIDQDIHRVWPTFTVTVVDPKAGKFRQRDALSQPCGRGYEYLASGREVDRYGGVAIRYGKSYDLVEDAISAAKHAKEKLTAQSVQPGQYDLVLDPSHLWLTIHESVGHPLELDRVLGYEANYAGTSFATLDKWKSKSFAYGSPAVTLFADKTQEGSLGGVGYDDEGVQTKRWDLVKDGILVDYQTIRDQVHILGKEASDGCCYADSWGSVQFQRMPNVSLAPGREKLSAEQLIKEVERGIYIVGNGSYSIDQQRYNFQFGGQLFYEIRNGEITRMVEDVAYQANTQEFWNSCVRVCDQSDYRLGGSFFDGKGQPPQISAVSHGSSTARFNRVNVINTARKI